MSSMRLKSQKKRVVVYPKSVARISLQARSRTRGYFAKVTASESRTLGDVAAITICSKPALIHFSTFAPASDLPVSTSKAILLPFREAIMSIVLPSPIGASSVTLKP